MFCQVIGCAQVSITAWIPASLFGTASMDEKLKALPQEDQHAITRVVKKLACAARKFDAAILKKKPAAITGREVDVASPAKDSKAHVGNVPQAEGPQPSKFMPHPRPQLKLGILRLDYNYEAAPGDIDHPQSFKYKVIYRSLPLNEVIGSDFDPQCMGQRSCRLYIGLCRGCRLKCVNRAQ